MSRRLEGKRTSSVLIMLSGAVWLVACSGGGNIPQTTLANPPAASNPVPTVTSVTPASTTAGASDLTITVAGSSFVVGASIVWNGVDLPTTFVSNSELRAVIPAAQLAAPGTRPVQAENPAPGGGLSNSMPFEIQNGVPTITTISPTSVLAGVASFTLTVDGNNFVAGSSVLWDGAPMAVTMVSANRLTAEIPAKLLAVAGSHQLQVVSPAPGGGISQTVAFSTAAVVPRFAYALEPGRGVVTRFVVDDATGRLTESGQEIIGNPGDGPHGILITRSRQFLYTSSYGTGDVLAFQVNMTDGSLTPVAGTPANCGTGAEWMVEHPNGRFLYLNNDQNGTVCAYEIDSLTGALVPLAGSPYAAGSNPNHLAMDSAGRFLYAPDSGDETIHAFGIDAATGTLSYVNGSPFAAGGTGPWAAAVAPADGVLFVMNFDSVSSYQINAVEGAIAETPGSPFPVGAYPQMPAFDAAGQFLYLPEIDDAQDEHLYAFSFDSGTGSLTAIPGSPYSLGNGLGVFTITLNNALTRAYFLNYLPGFLSQYDVDPVTGALSLVETVPMRIDMYKLTLLEGAP